MKAALIIPALNEEQSIGEALAQVPPGLYDQVLVVDNGSTDRTAEVAAAHRAQVLREPRRGYGNACLLAIAHLLPDIEVVIFMDADGSDLPPEATRLIEPIAAGRADLVIGSRELGNREEGALSPHQHFGNKLAVGLIRVLHGFRYTDLGPFRAIRLSSLQKLNMADRNYGWTIEMQIKALQQGLRVQETAVTYRRRRAGASKVSGTVTGSIAAGCKILWTIARLEFRAA